MTMTYSQTYKQKPTKGETEHGLYREEVFIWKFVLFNQIKVFEV